MLEPRLQALSLKLTNVLLLAALMLFASTLAAEPVRLAPGDYKQGYERHDYVTNSLSLALREGRAADLLANSNAKHLGLPPLKISSGMEPSKEKIALGRKLFFDRRLSRNKTMSCAMCHVPEQGFTSNELRKPVGANGRSLKRNAPTILNVAFYSGLFADARETNLEQQVWSPLLAVNEMNNPSVGYVIETINSLPDYDDLFSQAFSSLPNMLNIGQAIAQYERALIAGDSAFDRWFYTNDTTALTEQQQAGFELFTGKAACITCHVIGEDYALFTDNGLHSTGLGYANSMLDGVIFDHYSEQDSQTLQIQVAPGVYTKLDRGIVASVAEQKINDVGRYEITLDPNDRWKYRTSSLRNIALTAPYMHSGTLSTLAEVVAFYNQGGVKHAQLSPLIRPLDLTDEEQAALVEFLRSLTSSTVAMLVSDAHQAVVGDTGLSSK